MAVGDIISALTGTVINTYGYYQPAAGVQIIVTSTFTGFGAEQRVALYDGTNLGVCRQSYSASISNTGVNTKIGITNSIYLGQFSDQTPTYFTGIQIK